MSEREKNQPYQVNAVKIKQKNDFEHFFALARCDQYHINNGLMRKIHKKRVRVPTQFESDFGNERQTQSHHKKKSRTFFFLHLLFFFFIVSLLLLVLILESRWRVFNCFLILSKRSHCMCTYIH